MAEKQFVAKFDSKESIKKHTKFLWSFEKKQLPFATAKTLTQIGGMAKKEVMEEIVAVFNSPNRWIRNSVFLRPAKKQLLEAIVYIKMDQRRAIEPHIFGGRRDPKGSEYLMRQTFNLPKNMNWMPGSAMNKGPRARGNQVQKVMSVLGATRDPYQRTTTRSRQRNKKLPQYFVVQKKGGALPPGVWQRHGRTRRGHKYPSQIKPVMIFTKAPRYRKRLDFHEITAEVYTQNFEKLFLKNLEHALRTAR